MLAHRYCCVLAVVLFFATGCANMTTTAPSGGDPFGSAALMQGHIHGGQQPIAFAAVQLYAAGTTGYGSAGTLYATTSTHDDGLGSWSLSKQANTDTAYPATGSTWACPASSDPFMYLVARGGNTQGTHLQSTNNTAAAAILAMGKCSTITTSSYFDLDEVTTAATLVAMQQFFNPTTESLGAPPTTMAQAGLLSAFGVIHYISNSSDGTTVATGTGNFATVTSESSKINTIADILASCVNNPTAANLSCTTLFANATPPSPAVTSQPAATFAAATDIVQAAYYMFVNPSNGSTAHLSALYGLSSSVAPFQPTIATQPYDWTIGATYHEVPNAITGCTNGPVLIGSEGVLATDIQGFPLYTNTGIGYPRWVWIGEGVDSHAFIYCDTGYQGQMSATAPSGTIYTTISNQDLILEVTTANAYQLYSTPYIPSLVVSDGSGNIFYTTANTNGIFQLTVGNTNSSGTKVIASVTGTPTSIVADKANNLWVATSSGLFELTKANGYAPTQIPNTGSSSSVPVGQLAASSTGAVLFPYADSSNTYHVASVTGSSTKYTVTSLPGTIFQIGIALDGAGNIWGANNGYYTIDGLKYGYVSETDSTGTPLVAPYGILKTVGSTTSGAGLQNQTVMGPSRSIVIDPAGNVWVTSTSANEFSVTLGNQYYITEIIGAAVPVAAPLSVAIANGTLGIKP